MSRRHKKSSRANESPQTKTDNQSVPEYTVPALDGSESWDRISHRDLRDMIVRYPNYGLRFPARVVLRLLDEIDRLEGQA